MMQKLIELLQGYERWEADLIMSDAAWSNRDLPQITQDLWEGLMLLQKERNELMAIIKMSPTDWSEDLRVRESPQ